MVSRKIHTKFTKHFHRPSTSSLANSVFNTSSSSSSQPFHNSLHRKSQFLSISHDPSFVHHRRGLLPSERSRTGTALLSANGQLLYASQLLDQMSHRKVQVPEHTLLRDVFKIVQSVNTEPNTTGAAMVHALAVKCGAVADLFTATSLLTIYSRSKDFGSSATLFGEVLDRDVVFWNAMMSACIENKCFLNAVDLFKKMMVEGDEFDHTTLVIVISALSNLKCLGQGKVVHGLSVKAGMLSDTVLGNAVIDMYAKCGDLGSSECVFSELDYKDFVTWNSIIIGCFYNRQSEKSLWYFRDMASCESQADDVSISCAMAACTCLHEFCFGQAIHGLGIKLGYMESNHVSVNNSIISFYSLFRDVYAAESVFMGMTEKNLVSWNAMIKGFFLNGEVMQAFCFLHDMQFVGSTQPDIATVVTIIPFCAELMLLREGKAAHGFAVRKEMASELSVMNSLINMYSKCNNVKKAEILFLTMPKKDLIAWNTMIFGYSQNGQSYEAKKLFKELLHSCLACNLPTLLAIIPSCDSPDSLQFGRSIHGRNIKLGFSNQIFALNSLMHMYISCGVLQDAFKLFGTVFIRADVTSWNTIIAGCTQKGHFQEAIDHFHSMRKTSQAHCNSITLVSAISACGNLGLAYEGKLIHALATKTGIGTDLRVQNSLVTMYGRLGETDNARLAFNLSDFHNLCSWNCVISALSQNEDAKKAIELFHSLNFEPNEITISTVLSACTHLGAITYGKQIHGHVFRFGFQNNPFVSAALVDMYSNCGKLDIAVQVFQRSPEKSVAAWNSLISAYGFHNFGSLAITTFHEMIQSGIRPTNSTLTSLLQACSHSGMVNEGRMYYNLMLERYKVKPTTEHHVCMVDMIGRSGRLQEAYEFIENLSIEPEPAVWGALLSACSYHGDLQLGRKVAEILFSLEPKNVSYYVSLCNMYVAAGKWEEAVELRTIIGDKQLKKPAGYSSIDLGLSE